MSKTIYRHLVTGLVGGLALAGGGAETPAQFLGASSCASTSCHGGGGAGQNQFLIWSVRDVHSQRPPATLTTARSRQIAAALEITNAAADARCTVCHAPLQAVPENRRGEHFAAAEGVSCESCHGPAEPWLRSHTRPDYTHAGRVAAGMRDLQDLYVRANICVACHQKVDADLLQAGHPELMFELDGQSVAEPKHWRAEKNGSGAQAWLVGQAVALRELSWQISRAPHPDAKLTARRDALVWLLQTVSARDDSDQPGWPAGAGQDATAIAQWADQVARAAAAHWPENNSVRALKCLSLAGGSFQNISHEVAARRAERLVLALDRLVAALPELNHHEPVQSALNELFRMAQSVPDFDAKPFADALRQFSAALGPGLKSRGGRS